MNYCAYCEKFKAERLHLLKEKLGDHDPVGINIANFDPQEDWFRNYRTGNLLEPARTNEGKGLYILKSLRGYERQLLEQIRAEEKASLLAHLAKQHATCN